MFLDASLSNDDPVVITGATAADPCVITTSAAHGYANDDLVVISDITWTTTEDIYGNFDQPAQLNGGTYKVANVTSTTFELVNNDTGVDVDASAFDAYVSGGESRKKYSVFNGLHHLSGETVQALAEGNVIKNLTVGSTGTLILDRAYARLHVGIPYTAEIETLDPEITSRYVSTIQGQKKKVAKLDVRFERSRGAWLGPTTTDLVEMKTREFEEYGEATRLITGDEEVVLTGRWNDHGRLVIRQRDPLPMTILAIVADYV